MLNIIYNSFPFGNAELFAEYEIPFLNEITGGQYRVFSFYAGKDLRPRDNNKILGKVYIIRPAGAEYLKALFAFFTPSVLRELKPMKNRVCRDNLLRCLWRMLNYRAYGYALLKKAKKIGVSEDDIFVSYWLNECAYAACMLKNKHKGIKAVSRAHGFDVFEERCYLPFRKELFERMDCVYPINRIEKQYLLDHYPESISEDRIRVSHLGIDIPEAYVLNAGRSLFTIVTCSSIIPLKRLDLMIDALSEIKEFDFRWIHIGGGPLEEEMKKSAAKKLCEPNQSYEFLGQLPLSEVHRFYRENDVSLFVNCSDTEGVPVSIMEAMSYGIPALARDVGGNSEIVDDHNGILLKTNCSAHDLAEGLRAVYLKNNDDYIAMRQAAREKVEREFNTALQYREFFTEVLKPLANQL